MKKVKAKDNSTKYCFRARVWRYKGPPGGWHFVTLPKSLSKKIRKNYGQSEEGWGRLKTIARIGDTEWKTSIWYDTKAQSYLLPLKASVRKSEKIIYELQISVELMF